MQQVYPKECLSGDKMPNVRDLVRRSHKATCGIMERELVVKTRLKGVAIRKLREAGYRILGTSYDSGDTTRIWFIMRGGF
ncbi:unnamed protein product [marine sediment metagenome]|uniref:Uncharacterized protein n=1 Tax=marine sediment metagenome TaxID=412755 RepID=X0XKY1_9ZZZZ